MNQASSSIIISLLLFLFFCSCNKNVAVKIIEERDPIVKTLEERDSMRVLPADSNKVKQSEIH